MSGDPASGVAGQVLLPPLQLLLLPLKAAPHPPLLLPGLQLQP